MVRAIVLFILTVASVYIQDLSQAGGITQAGARHWLPLPWYTIGILGILLAHESGHYLMSRVHGVRTSLPYFLPCPFSPFGTFGAVMAIKSNFPNRRALFDVGAAGPLLGFVVSLPAIVVGLGKSAVVAPSGVPEGGLSLGEPLVFKMLAWAVVGDVPDGYDILLHPLAYAGWVALWITGLNLLPIGQLDGGHVAYALLGGRGNAVSKVMVGGLAATVVLGYYHLAFLLVLIFIFRRSVLRHPPTLDDGAELDWPRRLVGIGLLLLCAACFVPMPFLIY